MAVEHVVSAIPDPIPVAGGRARVHLVPAWRDNLIWVVAPEGSDRAWVVDGPEADGVQAWCRAHGRRLAGILNTHTHPDHIGINRQLDEAGHLGDIRVWGPAAARQPIPGLDHPVDQGDRVEIDGIGLSVHRTDGHQDGHIVYVTEGAVFCGDTLFAAGCGYLFDGPPSAMFDSLLRLAALPGDTLVFCAHEYTEDNLRFAWMLEPDNEALADRIRRVWADRARGRCTIPCTIAEEQATNPFLRPGSPTLQARLAERMPEADLSTPLGVFTAVRALKDRKDHRALSDQDLPLDP